MNKNDKLEAKERINFFLNVLQKTMKTCDMKLGCNNERL